MLHLNKYIVFIYYFSRENPKEKKNMKRLWIILCLSAKWKLAKKKKKTSFVLYQYNAFVSK